MKLVLLILFSNLVPLACVFAAFNMAMDGVKGWGWFLAIAAALAISYGGNKSDKGKTEEKTDE